MGGFLPERLSRYAATLRAPCADRAVGVSEARALGWNPQNLFAYMARATCLVMSSDYKGQPMVILEARVLGLPVVSTRLDSVDSALVPDEGLVVERDVAALAEGLRMHVDGAVPATRLDYEAYRRECLDEFYRAIGAE